MKLSYLIVGLVLVALIAGCAPKAETSPAAPTGAPTTDVVPEAAETAPAEVPAEAAAPATTEIGLLVSGFDPAKEVAVKAGGIVTFRAVTGNHMLTINGKSLGKIEQGSVKEETFDKAGTYKVFDIFTKKSTTVVVTE